MKPNNITVLGTGAWGTALALLLAKNGFQVTMWGKFPAEVADIKQHRCNTRYLPNIKFPDNITITSDLQLALQQAPDVLIAVPSHAFRETLTMLRGYQLRLFWATKGLANNQLLHEVVAEVLGKIPMAVISGPTFALEVAQGLPTAITVAANNQAFATSIVNYLHNKTFRVYTNDDLIGVQVGGAIKNVLAIAVGIADGLQLGANARAALITRSLTELTRLGKALGGKTETFMGLAGLGDLVLTCTDNQSRNRRFGLALGAGMTQQAAASTLQTIEGIPNAKAAHALAVAQKIDMPIVEQVYNILYKEVTPQHALQTLLNRTPKPEF